MNQDAREALERAIFRLNSIDTSDPVRAHGEADDVLLQLLLQLGMPSVCEAYVMLMERTNWWSNIQQQ